MFQIFLFIGFLRRTSNYLERIALFGPTHMISIIDPLAINVETPRINSGCSLEKEFTKLIYIIPIWYCVKLLIKLIHMTIVYMVLCTETLKTSCGWMIMF